MYNVAIRWLHSYNNRNIIYSSNNIVVVVIHHIVYVYMYARHLLGNNFEYHHTNKEAFNAPAAFAVAVAAVRVATESGKPAEAAAAARLAGC